MLNPCFRSKQIFCKKKSEYIWISLCEKKNKWKNKPKSSMLGTLFSYFLRAAHLIRPEVCWLRIMRIHFYVPWWVVTPIKFAFSKKEKIDFGLYPSPSHFPGVRQDTGLLRVTERQPVWLGTTESCTWAVSHRNRDSLGKWWCNEVCSTFWRL